MIKSNITIRNAKINEVFEIHKILSKSFEPYKKYYTKRALNETVISPLKIKNNITDKIKEVKVVIYQTKIIGTMTITYKKNFLYISSMAIKPEYQKLGIGKFILDEICVFAKEKDYNKLLVETFEPLKSAISLYEKYGFSRNGKKRNFFGIEIFEMIKKLD